MEDRNNLWIADRRHFNVVVVIPFPETGHAPCAIRYALAGLDAEIDVEGGLGLNLAFYDGLSST